MADEFIIKKGLIVADLVYPNSDGTPGQTIVTDGSGNLVLQDLAAANVTGLSAVATSGTIDDLTNVDTTGAATGSVLKWNGSAWAVGTDDGSSQNLWETISGDSGSATANSATDTLTIAGGTNVTTSVVGDTLTINTTAEPNQNTFSTVEISAGSGTASGDSTLAADTTTDTLTLVAGDNITLTGNAAGDQITIAAAGGGGGATNLNDLADVSASPTTGQVLKWSGSVWEAADDLQGTGGGSTSVERAQFTYTSGSGGDLSAVDAITSSTAGVTPSVADGANALVDFTFSGKSYPPVAIIVYGYDYQNNQYLITNMNPSIPTRLLNGGGSAGSPTAFDGSFTSSLRLQLRMSDVGASAGFGQRSECWVQFVFV